MTSRLFSGGRWLFSYKDREGKSHFLHKAFYMNSLNYSVCHTISIIISHKNRFCNFFLVVLDEKFVKCVTVSFFVLQLLLPYMLITHFPPKRFFEQRKGGKVTLAYRTTGADGFS